MKRFDWKRLGVVIGIAALGIAGLVVAVLVPWYVGSLIVWAGKGVTPQGIEQYFATWFAGAATLTLLTFVLAVSWMLGVVEATGKAIRSLVNYLYHNGERE